MTFYYNKQDRPVVILDENTSRRLLLAIRAGCIDMAHFTGLYSPGNREESIKSQVSAEVFDRATDIMRRLQDTRIGQAKITLTRELKLRLLKAVRSNEICIFSDFPELAKAHQSMKIDYSVLSEEECGFILEFCRTVN